MRDWRGVDLFVGATVLYSVKTGSSGVWTRVAKVEELLPKEESHLYAPQDRVRLNVVEKSDGGTMTKLPLVHAHLCTVITVLPPPSPNWKVSWSHNGFRTAHFQTKSEAEAFMMRSGPVFGDPKLELIGEPLP